MIKELGGAFIALGSRYLIFDIKDGSRLSDERFKEFLNLKKDNDFRRSNKRKAEVKSYLHVVMYLLLYLRNYYVEGTSTRANV